MDVGWKPNWEETRQHFVQWWHHTGLVLGSAGVPARTAREQTVDPGPAPSIEAHYADAQARALRNHHQLAHRAFPADAFPISDADIGPGSLALAMGSAPGFSPETVWFNPTMAQDARPEHLPALRFDPDSRWWRVHEQTLRACTELGRGKYTVGCPDLVENIDILASLRGTQQLLLDMIERPAWVESKVYEINDAFMQAYQRVYDIIRLDDGGAVFGAFRLWGPGKTAKVQCDAAALFSAEMFVRFVVPALEAQCAWLDYSMFHLDGAHCLHHLDALLAIDALDAIEWTPNPKVPPGGDPAWYALYRRILDAGKSVQAVGVRPKEVIPLLDAVGGKGMYVMTSFETLDQAEAMARLVEPYR
ncbi:MAG: hypothetical protein JXA09_15340 [Anaerolineae bacterium]|nr:hypothetical protein [Anaerolineae bacterium]